MKSLIPVKIRNKVIPDYYMDPNSGEIYSNKRTSLEKLNPSYDNSTGYLKINLRIDGKAHQDRIHRIVAETLIPFPCPEGISKADWKATPESVKNLLCSQYRVNHIDHDKTNFHPSNLEWVTAQGNSKAYFAFKAGVH